MLVLFSKLRANEWILVSGMIATPIGKNRGKWVNTWRVTNQLGGHKRMEGWMVDVLHINGKWIVKVGSDELFSVGKNREVMREI